MSDFDWDTRQFGKPVSRRVINGITMAYFRGHSFPRFYGGDADKARRMYGDRLHGNDPRVQQIMQSHDLLGNGRSVPRPTSSGRSHGPSKSVWREMADNTFGTGKTHGDIYNMAHGLVELPGVASDAVANIMSGAWNSGVGLYDEATGNYADEQQRAAAAQASANKSIYTFKGMFGANPGGMLYRTVDAAGLGSAGDTSDAATEMKGVGHDALVHPVQTAAALLPLGKFALLNKAAELEKLAEASSGAQKAALMQSAAKLRYIANGGRIGQKVDEVVGNVKKAVSSHPVAGPVMGAVRSVATRTAQAVDDVNHFRNPAKPKGSPSLEATGGVARTPKSSEAPGKPGASFDSGKPTTVTASNPAANSGLLPAHPKTGLKLNGVSWTPSGQPVHQSMGKLLKMSDDASSDAGLANSDAIGSRGTSNGASADAGALSSFGATSGTTSASGSAGNSVDKAFADTGLPKWQLQDWQKPLRSFLGPEWYGESSDATASGVGSASESTYVSKRPMKDVFPELEGVNPHYVEGAGPGVNTNCASVTNAVHARLTGSDPNAVAAKTGYVDGHNALLPSASFGFGPETTPAQVVNEMSKAGDGATRPLIIRQPSGIHHSINVVNRGGDVHFVDGQSGHIVTINPDLTVELGRPN